MTASAATIPAETDLLCESCGYVLNGLTLSVDTRCPECGRPTAESSPALRHPPAWESPGKPVFARWLETTQAVWFHPTAFYRSLATRRPARDAAGFAHIHWAIASILFAAAALGHARWLEVLSTTSLLLQILLFAAVTLTTDFFLIGTNRLAASLTRWEGAYRGLRLPLPVVIRGLHYHAAHYLPVGLLAAVTVWGYQLFIARHVLSGLSATTYLYVLSAEVVLSAGYLFRTYWTGMRNMMYANG